MKLHHVNDGPPSLACRMTLKALNIPYELIDVNYNIGEHLTDEYAKLNPQKEIPVLDDDGFLLSESIAIMQYLCDKYAPESPLYPKDAKQRAIVNHRLLFNMQFYYKNIGSYAIAPMFYDVPRDEMALKKVNLSLAAFEEYLKRSQTKYAAANTMTIADLGLVAGTLPLEAIDFSLDKYPLVAKWYSTFKQEYPELWAIGNDGKNVLADLEKNPPDLSKLNHPLYPKRK